MKTIFFFFFSCVLSLPISAQTGLMVNIPTVSQSPESVSLFADGSYLVSSSMSSVCQKRQLSLELYDASSKLVWFRTYPQVGDVESQTQLIQYLGQSYIFFTANGESYMSEINRTDGNLSEIQPIESGEIGKIAMTETSISVELRSSPTTANLFVFNCERGKGKILKLPKSNQALVVLTPLPGGNLFYSYGQDFGILSDSGDVKQTWEYEGLQITNALVMPGDTTLLLSGQETSQLFGPKNEQGYLALVSINDFDKVYWTKQVGSDYENDHITEIYSLPDGRIGFVLHSDKNTTWNIITSQGKLQEKAVELGNLESTIRHIGFHQDGSKYNHLLLKSHSDSSNKKWSSLYLQKAFR